MELRGNIDKLHISRKTIAKYGATPSCQRRKELAKRNQQPSKFMYNHSDECRDRIIEDMKDDAEHNKLLEKHCYTMGTNHPEIMTKEQMQEKKHQTTNCHYTNRTDRETTTSTWYQTNTTKPSDEDDLVWKYGRSRNVQSPRDCTNGAQNWIARGLGLNSNNMWWAKQILGIQLPTDEKRSREEIHTRQTTTIHRQSHVRTI